MPKIMYLVIGRSEFKQILCNFNKPLCNEWRAFLLVTPLDPEPCLTLPLLAHPEILPPPFQPPMPPGPSLEPITSQKCIMFKISIADMPPQNTTSSRSLIHSHPGKHSAQNHPSSEHEHQIYLPFLSLLITASLSLSSINS